MGAVMALDEEMPNARPATRVAPEAAHRAHLVTAREVRGAGHLTAVRNSQRADQGWKSPNATLGTKREVLSGEVSLVGEHIMPVSTPVDLGQKLTILAHRLPEMRISGSDETRSPGVNGRSEISRLEPF
jgi:hypothetical protein